MAITAASIEANGWVLRVTVSGALSSTTISGYSVATANDNATQWATNFAAYALNPNGATPGLTLAIGGSNGFVQSGGTAVASSTVSRTLVGTKALRRATVVGNTVGTRVPKNPDETDNGDGTVTVRIALSQHVYAGDSGLTLAALAGWRTGAGVSSGIAVTNNSTVLPPAPIVRWSDVPYQLQSGPFTLECVVASHHPNGVAPVAGVRFTVTDGTTVKSYWATALSTSTAYPAKTGDGANALALRVYTVTVDPTQATALTKGLLRCDFEVYPWIGPVAKSDVAATRSMTSLGTAASSTSAFVPFVVAWNPGNSWIVPRYAYVAAGGATTAAAANTSTVAAAAAATPLATINLAIESLRLAAGTLAAANGQAAVTQSLDGCRVRLKAGTYVGVGTTAVTFGANVGATWFVIEGDPADPNPRANCILQSPPAANPTSQVSRNHIANLTLLAQTNAVVTSSRAWIDNVEIRAVAGQTATTGQPFAPSSGLYWITGSKWWQHGTAPALSGNVNPILVRATVVERAINAPVVLNCARLPSALAGFAGVAASASTDPGAALERMVVACDWRYLTAANAMTAVQLANASLPTAAPYAPGQLALGKTYNAQSRFAWLNNTCEIYGVAPGYPLFSGIGENVTIVSSENIIEGNTFTGDRTNVWYNDLNLATIALNDSENCIVQVNRFANNVVMKCASKHDTFQDPAVQQQRIGVALSATRSKAYAVGAEIVIAGTPANVYHCTTAGTTAATGGPTGTGSAISDGSVVWQWLATEARQHGYRPQAIGAWSSAYGVTWEGNIDFLGASDPTFDPEFNLEFFGLGSLALRDVPTNATATPFTVDKSGTSNRLAFQPLPDGIGGGNYTPLSTGSGPYILGRAKTANVDTDGRGVARVAPFAAGAIEGITATTLVPAADRQASHAAATTTGWAVTLAVARAMLATHASAAVAIWATTLGSAAGQLATHAGNTALGFASTIAAAGGRLASAAAATVAGWRIALAVDGTVAATAAASGLVTWSGSLSPVFARSLQTASAAIVTVAGPWLILVDAGRIAIVDRTLPILLPGTTTPPERTLIVAGDLRVTLA